jgi:hypothetical protein
LTEPAADTAPSHADAHAYLAAKPAHTESPLAAV